MPVVFTEGRHPGEAIMAEGNGDISRDNVTIPESQSVEANSLLARRGVQHVPYDPDAVDGAEIPVAYSIYRVVTAAGETKKAAVISRLATLNGHNIAWPDDITPEQKDDAVRLLAERFIIVR